MYRVVTKYLDRQHHLAIEHGPWLASRSNAEGWVAVFRSAGYNADVESDRGAVREHDHPGKATPEVPKPAE